MANDVVELGRSAHWIVEHDRSRSFVRLRRTAEPLTSVQQIQAQIVDAGRILAGVDRSELALLMDLRDGPLRNDDEYETALGGREMRFFEGFRRVVTLVRTQIGKLQVMRRTRETGVTRQIYTDEAEALAAASSPWT